MLVVVCLGTEFFSPTSPPKPSERSLMQRADLAWRGISAPSCAGSLALVLRGQGFRIGGHRSRTHTSQLEEQLRAVTSVHDHVVVPAERNGWSLSLALHVFAPPRHVDAF